MSTNIFRRGQRSDERGIALIMSMIGLVIVGGLVSAVFAASMIEQRVAESTRRAGQSFSVAELGLTETLGTWNTGVWNGLGVLDSVSVSGNGAGGGTYNAVVRRLNPELFLIDVRGWDAAGGTRQHVGTLVKLRLLNVDIQAALTTKGPTKVGGSADIDGYDHIPAGWNACPPLDSAEAGLRLPDASDLTTIGGCSGASCIDGSPPVQVDSTVNDSTFFQFGDVDWAALTSMATKNLAPGTYPQITPSYAGAVCNFSDPFNWGDPHNPLSGCGNYFPIIYISGNASINGAFGQGMLLVEGDLSVQGGFEFYGIVIIKGKLKTTGTGGHFNGGVLAANVDLEQSSVLGNAIMNYSKCAIGRALSAASPGAQLRSRGWLYAF